MSRRRFAPVKTTNDLLVVRSDAYGLTDEDQLELAPHRSGLPVVDLDPRFHKLLHDFEARFPVESPSLIACARLTVVGDVAFGRGVVVRGSVTIEHPGRASGASKTAGPGGMTGVADGSPGRIGHGAVAGHRMS